VATPSAPELLVLHAVRVRGMADSGAVARRYGLDRAEAEELLLDFEAWGWVTHTTFHGTGGWSLTDAGRAEDERRVAAELDAAGARHVVEHVHEDFVPLNERFLAVTTDWQIRPTPWDAMAANDHADWRWDERVVRRLRSLHRRVTPLCLRLSERLERFDGYPDRYRRALARVEHGDPTWVDHSGIDSCHTVWFELHEDLLSTLGLERGR
jgi:hypothetical protein